MIDQDEHTDRPDRRKRKGASDAGAELAARSERIAKAVLASIPDARNHGIVRLVASGLVHDADPSEDETALIDRVKAAVRRSSPRMFES